MKKEKFKFKGLKIKRYGTLIMFFVPKEITKDRIYFTDYKYLRSLMYGTREYMYANRWYNNKKKNNDIHREAKLSLKEDSTEKTSLEGE